MASQAAPFPMKDPIARQGDGLMTLPWVNWFTQLLVDVSSAPLRVHTVSLVAQTDSIGATAIPMGTLSEGLYRISYTARVTTAATTSSSLTVYVGTTQSGVACQYAGTALTGNTTASVVTGTFLVKSDAQAPITYSTAYSSTGATAMAYAMDVVAERVDA